MKARQRFRIETVVDDDDAISWEINVELDGKLRGGYGFPTGAAALEAYNDCTRHPGCEPRGATYRYEVGG